MSDWNHTIALEGWAISQEWNVFTRMVCTSIGWVIPVVCSDHQEVIFTHRSDDFWQAFVKFMQAIAVAVSIATVTVKSIKVYQVGK